MHSYLMQDNQGQIQESYSVSAGLDFPSVGPQHAHLAAIYRAEYPSVTDKEALDAFQELAKSEGIIPALESSHALAHALKMARSEPEKSRCLSSTSPAVATKISSPLPTSLKKKEPCHEPLRTTLLPSGRSQSGRLCAVRDAG